jgi:DNA-binding MarR family transcriptional regulator
MATISRAHGNAGIDACAAAVMDAGLLISRFVRAELWRHKPEGLTIAQFRGMAYVNAYPGSAPSELADYLMLSRPAVTRLVDELVRRRLIGRHADPADRRRFELTLTVAGRRMLDSHFTLVRGLVAERLASLTVAERGRIRAAMEVLSPRFGGGLGSEVDV